MIEIAFQVATAIALLGLAVAAVRASWRLAGRIENRDGETRAAAAALQLAGITQGDLMRFEVRFPEGYTLSKKLKHQPPDEHHTGD